MKILYPTQFGDFFVDKDENHKLANLLQNNVFNQEEVVLLLEKLLPTNGIFFDIGANLGLVSIPLSKIAKEVHSFEPIPLNQNNFLENVAQNKAKNVTLHPYALGASAGRAGATMRTEGSTGTFTLTEGSDFEIKTLDSLTNLPKPSLIKIDVEGMEPDVLLGAKETLKKSRPTILFEINVAELKKHNKNPFSLLSKTLSDYDIYLPLKEKLLRIPSIALMASIHEPGAFFGNSAGGVFDLVAIPKGTPSPIAVYRRPCLTLISVLVKKITCLVLRRTYSW